MMTHPVEPNLSHRLRDPSPREEELVTPSTQEIPPSGISVTLTSARSSSPSGETSSGVESHSTEERSWQRAGSGGGGGGGRGGYRSSSVTVSRVRGGRGGAGGDVTVGDVSFECGCVRKAKTRSQSASSSASSGASSIHPNFGADLQRSTGGLHYIQ